MFSKSKFTVSELNRMARGLQNGGKPEPAPGSGGPQLVSETEETEVAGRELSDISSARRSEGEVSKEMQLLFWICSIRLNCWREGSFRGAG